METTIQGLGLYGRLSTLWSFLGYPKYQVPYYNGDPNRDHNFDNHPYETPPHILTLNMSLHTGSLMVNIC